jgi:hypothetical protein
MATRSEQLADELQHVTDEVIAYIEGVPDKAWQRSCAAEQCTVAALAYHIADAYRPIVDDLVRPLAEGQEALHFSLEDLATASQKYAAQPKAVVLERLCAQAPAAIAYVRGLSDAQLQRAGTMPWGGDPITAEAVITHILIAHPHGHLASMQAATT